MRDRCTEQTFGLCGRRRGWDSLRAWNWNKYTIKGETDHQPWLDAWDKCSGLVHWEDPEGWYGEGESGWGTHVNPWLIHVNVWQKPLQYCKVISLQLIKINGKKKRNGNSYTHTHTHGGKACEDGGERLEFCGHKSRKAKSFQQTPETRKGQTRICPQIRRKMLPTPWFWNSSF